MTSWHERTLFAFDTETTGVDPETARIVTASIIRITPVSGGREVYPYSWLLDPGVDIPAEATAVHGITTERAREDGQDASVGVAEIAKAIGAAWYDGHPVIIYNAAYDLTVLDRELRRYGWAPLTPGPVVDPLVIDKQVDRYRRGKRTLEAACVHYDARLEGAHDSDADAIAAARVAWRLAQRYPDIAGMTVDKLHAAQVLWRAEQSASLRAYWEAQGDPRWATVDGSWPLIPYAAEGVPA